MVSERPLFTHAKYIMSFYHTKTLRAYRLFVYTEQGTAQQWIQDTNDRRSHWMCKGHGVIDAHFFEACQRLPDETDDQHTARTLPLHAPLCEAMQVWMRDNGYYRPLCRSHPDPVVAPSLCKRSRV
jgi:hypothetical protein